MSGIIYKEILNPSGHDLDLLEKLEGILFKDFGQPLHLKKEAEGRKNLLAQVAYLKETAVGFKLGYESKPGTFYSWLGGVLPEHRRQGIAQELLRLQHKAVQALGYAKITTASRNKFPEMLILNIKNGFHIVGTQFRPQEQDIAILFEKTF